MGRSTVSLKAADVLHGFMVSFGVMIFSTALAAVSHSHIQGSTLPVVAQGEDPANLHGHWSHLSQDATKQVCFSLRRPLGSKRLWSSLWDLSNCLWLKSKSHFTFLVMYVSDCPFKANKYCLCFCDRHHSAHTSQHSWCGFCDYFSAGTSCHICSQTETQKEISFYLSTAVVKWPPFFHHFPLMSFIILKPFACLVLFLSSPWGSPISLFSFNPFAMFTASTLHTVAPVCPWDVGCLTGLCLPSYVPVVAFRWGQSPLASTAAPQLCSVTHCFVQQLLGSQSSNFLHPTDPVLQNSPNLQKTRWME